MNGGKKYEILSPAGSIEQLVAAVNNGCDSVYLGLDNFNARMKAPNFNAENIGYWVDFCHFFGVKVYVAVNTSVKNSEFFGAIETLLTAYKNNADGVIVTDLALLRYAATLQKPFEVVASTQLNVHDAFGARFLKQLGANMVVCARESSFDEIQEIAKENVKVESFLHGALCVCQSGQCLFSSMVGGNSGNRGLCAQPCRKLYKATVGNFQDGGYLLSASDICGLNTAQKLLNLGVSTFKIEGRNRRAEYAGLTAKVYSQFFARDFENSKSDKELLCEMFNRGNLPSNNYLYGKNSDIIYPFAQNHIGVEVGRIRDGKIVTTTFLTKGDGLKVFCGKREFCGGIVTLSGSGIVSAEFSDKVKNGMTVCRTSSVELNEKVLSARRKRSVSVKLTAFSENKAILTLSSEGVSVSVESDFVVQRARQKPTTETELAQQLQKIGDLQYTISDIAVYCDKIFVAKSQINALRRLAFEKLGEEIISQYNSAFQNRKSVLHYEETASKTENATNCLAVICYNADQIDRCKKVADYVIFKPEIICEQTVLQPKIFCYLDLPSFSDNTFVAKLLRNKKMGIVCHNVGQVQMARESGLRYIAGTGLNIFNDQMAEMFSDADTFFYSQELTLSEVAAFSHKNGLVFVDGKLVLMKLVHCPFKAVLSSTCENCLASENLSYTDELGNQFRLQRRKDARCSFELINGKKLSVCGKLQKGGRYCVDFDSDVINHYVHLNNGETDNYVEKLPYTKGRLYNKIN